MRAGLEAAVAASGADEVVPISNTPDAADRRASVTRLSRIFSLATA